MSTKSISVLLFITLLTYSCDNVGKENTTSNEEVSKSNQHDLEQGFQLMETSCFSCHSPNASIETSIAPSIKSIKEHYAGNKVSYEQFAQDLRSFLNNPSEENSKMPDAIARYNLMPKMSLSDEQISSIAKYLYHSELEKPDWFEKHYSEEKKKYAENSAADSSPIAIGQSIAMKTKGVLGKNLLEAINSKGTENAVSFCSTRAIPLTDSMAIAMNAMIKRVSDKSRNPQNKANTAELNYIEKVKLAIAEGKTPEPQLTVFEHKQIGYYPIVTNTMCLQCHGQVETEIFPKTLSTIKELYPNDQATGYKVDELRGIWVVEMDIK